MYWPCWRSIGAIFGWPPVAGLVKPVTLTAFRTIRPVSWETHPQPTILEGAIEPACLGAGRSRPRARTPHTCEAVQVCEGPASQSAGPQPFGRRRDRRFPRLVGTE